MFSITVSVVKPGILQDHGKHLTQIVAGEVSDVVAIYQDRAAVDVVEPHQQFDHGGLASSGRADNGDLLAGGNGCREIIDDDFVRAVAKVDIFELHTTFNRLEA